MTTKIAPSIIALAQGVEKKYGIPAAVCLAQYRIESANGTKFTGTWNCWGIKALAHEPMTLCWTHEVINDVSKLVQQPFRNYASLAESFDAYGKLLSTAKVYAPAIVAWKAGNQDQGITLMAAKYATGPTYASLIRQVIFGSNLNQYNLKENTGGK